ncbi:MAG: hypothetical protein HY211_03615 [Candidatus Omnitrophica bacterium]|nr:hypothetical protein [Candidatus Omnitrophota bacterium]
MRRIPLEYGDNFPVPAAGSWNPTVPWRFPRHQVRSSSLKGRLLPWVMLGLGVTLGVLWMCCWRVVPSAGEVGSLKGLSVEKPGAAIVPWAPSGQPSEGIRRTHPKKLRSRFV